MPARPKLSLGVAGVSISSPELARNRAGATPDVRTPGDSPLSRTVGLAAQPGSAVSPLVEEATWRCWRLSAANPRLVNTLQGAQAVTGMFDHLVEAMWAPGRASLVAELSVSFVGAAPVLSAYLGVALYGGRGETAAESEAASGLVDSLLCRPGMPYLIEPADPAFLLDIADPCHAALLQQRIVTVDNGEEEIAVLSRWHPTIDPWGSLTRLLATRREPTTVRATVLPTELSAADRLALQEAVGAASRFQVTVADRPDLSFHAERVIATLIDLQASFATPLMITELAVTSDGPLPEVFLRGVGAAFTSATDVLRQGHTIVAGERLILGGFEIDRDPVGLGGAQRAGLPLRGGMGPRELRHLATLSENIVRWPVPSGGCRLPGIPTAAAQPRPVPAGLDVGLFVGHGMGGVPVRIPDEERERHLVALGVTGTGKTTVLCRAALADLRAGRGFALIDPHGSAADRVIAHADDLGVEVVVLDPDDAGTAQFALVPQMDADAENTEEVEQAITHCCDAIANNFPDPAWTGPRWHTLARSMLALEAALGLSISDTMTLVSDPAELARELGHPLVPVWARTGLALLHHHSHNDSASVREWLYSKFTTFTSGPARKLIAPSGRGVDLADAVGRGTPVIVNLAPLSESDAGMVGHLILARVLEAAMERPADCRDLFPVYVDEAHRFPARNIDRVLAEGRKFGISLGLATQSLLQLPLALADAVASANIRMVFRQSGESAARLAELMDVPPSDLVDQPNLRAYLKIAGFQTCSVQVPPYEPCPPLRSKGRPIRGSGALTRIGRGAA